MSDHEMDGPVRLAAIDVGSNSFHLIVVEVERDGSLRVLLRTQEMVRLGESSLHDGIISRQAFNRGLHALEVLTEQARLHRPQVIGAVATSAVREASNGRSFADAAYRACGLPVRVIDGAEEARLIFQGARQGLPLGEKHAALFDVGGGSTQAVLGNEHQALLSSSLKIGVLRLRDNWLSADPPSPHDTAVMSEWVRTVITPTILRFKSSGMDLVTLTSGTALTMARLAGKKLPAAGGIARYLLPIEALRSWELRLTEMTRADRACLPELELGRVDTIVPGAVILRSILETTGLSQAIVCDAALREGLIIDQLARRQQGSSRVVPQWTWVTPESPAQTIAGG